MRRLQRRTRTGQSTLRIGIDLSPLRHSAQRGIGTYAAGLVQALGRVAPEHEYVLFALSAVDDVNYPPRHRIVRIPDVRLGRASALVTGQLAVPWLAVRAGVDLLHTLDVPYNPSHPAPPAIRSVALVVTLHDLTPLYSPLVQRTLRYRHYYRLGLRLAGRANALVLDSNWSRREALRARVGRHNAMFVAPLAPPDEGPVSSNGSNIELPPTPYIMHVGSDDWNKNREGVLRAFTRLAPLTKLSLVLVGGGNESASNLPDKVRSRVFHYSGLTRAELDALYRHATVFVFPSRYEGFGLPLLEAMTAGVPVVTSDRGAMREVAGEAALLVNPEDPDAIASAVRAFVTDHELAGRLRDLGKRRAAAFSWERTARATLKAYEYVASRLLIAA